MLVALIGICTRWLPKQPEHGTATSNQWSATKWLAINGSFYVDGAYAVWSYCLLFCSMCMTQPFANPQLAIKAILSTTFDLISLPWFHSGAVKEISVRFMVRVTELLVLFVCLCLNECWLSKRDWHCTNRTDIHGLSWPTLLCWTGVTPVSAWFASILPAVRRVVSASRKSIRPLR